MVCDLLTEDWCSIICIRRHAFSSNCYADLDTACNYLVGNLLDSEEAGGAEAVGYRGGGGDGIAGCEDGGAGHVALAGREDISEADIFNEIGVEFRLFADDLADCQC